MDLCEDDTNFTLKWSDNTFMNYSLIPWCDAYPNNLCNDTIIYFNVEGMCIANEPYDVHRDAVCGNPYQCMYNICNQLYHYENKQKKMK